MPSLFRSLFAMTNSGVTCAPWARTEPAMNKANSKVHAARDFFMPLPAGFSVCPARCDCREAWTGKFPEVEAQRPVPRPGIRKSLLRSWRRHQMHPAIHVHIGNALVA